MSLSQWKARELKLWTYNRIEKEKNSVELRYIWNALYQAHKGGYVSTVHQQCKGLQTKLSRARNFLKHFINSFSSFLFYIYSFNEHWCFSSQTTIPLRRNCHRPWKRILNLHLRDVFDLFHLFRCRHCTFFIQFRVAMFFNYNFYLSLEPNMW